VVGILVVGAAVFVVVRAVNAISSRDGKPA
jgi:hypothetical protein